MTAYHRVLIPTDVEFLNAYQNWVYGEVSKNYKRNKERIIDTVQVVTVRLLAKNFIARWFYKHLTDDLVDREQAIKMLGGSAFIFSSAKSQIQPIRGNRVRSLNSALSAHDTSLWRVSDLLEYAKFDFKRYFYSPQNHTIDSDKMLHLLGYEPGKYSSLQAMYRTKRLLPSEFTEHLGCTGLDKCSECARGKVSLYNRRLSLTHDWNDPSVAHAASKLRWNDRQVKDYLRCFRNTNIIKCVPDYVLRPDPRSVIDSYVVYHPKTLHISEKSPTPIEHRISINAGLLAYAAKLINNEVINDFKRITRTDDMGISLFNNGVSPEFGNDSVVAYTSSSAEENEHPEFEFLDASAQSQFSMFENHRDLRAIADSCQFDNETIDILNKIELGGMSVADYSDLTGVTISKIHRIRAHIMKELRIKASLVKETFDQIAHRIADKYNIEVGDILGNVRVGDCVRARTEFIMNMSVAGLDNKQISRLYNFTEAQIESALYRASVRPPAIEQQAVGF
jgi:hypothetical protein